MRNCPVCEASKATVLWRSDWLNPDGWPRPPYLDWKRCTHCGMIYGDHPDASQAQYDEYYNKFYGYGVADPEQELRIKARADNVAQRFPNDTRVVDLGGGEEGLANRLWWHGITDVFVIEAGEKIPLNIDLMFCEMVLEHIYDLPSAMQNIANSVVDGGTLIVDVPDATAVAFTESRRMPMLDYHQPHINHFRLIDMLNLMRRWGFELVNTYSYAERNLPCRYYEFVKDIDIIGERSRDVVTGNMAVKVAKLRNLGDEPCILWGVGDIASCVLAQHKPNIQYYVSNDPAFKGATIGGLPVYEKPIDDLPILVIAQAQKGALLKRIRETCDNEVIEI